MTTALAKGLRAPSGATPAPRVAPRADLHTLWVALLLFTVFTVSRIHQYYDLVARARPVLLLFLFAVGYAAIRPSVLTVSNLIKQWPGQIVVALGIVACLSALFGISTGSAGTFIIEDYGKTIIYCCILILAFRDWRDVKRLAWAYVIASAILVFISLFVFGISKNSRGLTYDANDAALVLLVGLPLTILAFQTSRGWAKLASALILVGIVVTIAKCSSRGGFLGLLVVAVALLVSLKGVSVMRRAIAVAVIAVALSLGARGDYWEFMATMLHPTQDYNWTKKDGRKEVAKRGIGYMMSYPAFGIGVNNFRMAEGTISDKALEAATGQGVSWRAAHNSFVQVGAEMGIPGLLLWSGMVFGSIVSCYRLRRRIPDQWLKGTADQRFLAHAATALPIAMLGFAVSSFFVSHAYTDPVYVLTALVVGLYVALGRSVQQANAAAVAAARPPVKRFSGSPWTLPRP